MKVSNSPKDFYGHLYHQRKAFEIANNESGALADQAVAALANHNYKKSTDAYQAYTQGKLPPAHIDARARRWVVKLFLAHLHHVMYEVELGTPPPKPYVLQHLGHVDYIQVPNWPM